MAESSFTVVYIGEALDAGRMEVRELAPALLALGDLVRETNQIINPSAPPVSLHITAFAPGSFGIDLVLVQQGLKHVVDLFSGESATALVNLKEALFVSGGGLLWLIKLIRGRRVTGRREIGQGYVRLTLEDGTEIDIPSQTIELHGQVHLRRRCREIVEPLTRDGIDRMQFRLDRQEDITLEIGTQDVPAFEPPAETVEPLVQPQTIEMNAAIATIAFQEGRKWRLSDGRSVFWAKIDDEAFLQRIDQGSESFRKGDILRVRMRLEQGRSSEHGLTTEWTVLNVIDHIPAAAPVELPYADGSE